MAAADEFKDKPTYVHQQWQTDFTYFKIIGWGWYYLATIMDDYSRYIITWELCKNMETDDAKRVVGVALQESGVDEQERPRLLTDNGSVIYPKSLGSSLKMKTWDMCWGLFITPKHKAKSSALTGR